MTDSSITPANEWWPPFTAHPSYLTMNTAAWTCGICHDTLSGYWRPEDAQEALQKHQNDHHTAPLHSNEVIRIIRDLIENGNGCAIEARMYDGSQCPNALAWFECVQTLPKAITLAVEALNKEETS